MEGRDIRFLGRAITSIPYAESKLSIELKQDRTFFENLEPILCDKRDNEMINDDEKVTASSLIRQLSWVAAITRPDVAARTTRIQQEYQRLND